CDGHTMRSNVTIFFFQAEDGIRDRNVTGVQTCALPIYRGSQRIAGVCGRHTRVPFFRGNPEETGRIKDPAALQQSGKSETARECGHPRHRADSLPAARLEDFTLLFENEKGQDGAPDRRSLNLGLSSPENKYLPE